jgi:hypothetical protein
MTWHPITWLRFLKSAFLLDRHYGHMSWPCLRSLVWDGGLYHVEDCMSHTTHPTIVQISYFILYDCCSLEYLMDILLQSKKKNCPATAIRRKGGEEVQLLLLLDLGTKIGWVVSVTSRPCFTPAKDAGIHWTRGWMGLRAGRDTKARRKILCLWRGSNPGHSFCSQTLYWLSYPSSHTPWKYIDEMLCKQLITTAHIHYTI